MYKKPLSKRECDKENWQRLLSKLYLNDLISNRGFVSLGPTAKPEDFDKETTCWEWQGSSFTSKRQNSPDKKLPCIYTRDVSGIVKAAYAHRVAWELYRGIKLGEHKLERIEELCRFDMCVSPHHFRLME